MQNIVKEFIEKKLEKSIVLEKPKDSSLGHFATPVAFSLAKELRERPERSTMERKTVFFISYPSAD